MKKVKKEVVTRKSKTNTGFKGISSHKATGKYEVRVIVKDNSKRNSFYVGVYPTIAKAVAERNKFITNLL